MPLPLSGFHSTVSRRETCSCSNKNISISPVPFSLQEEKRKG